MKTNTVTRSIGIIATFKSATSSSSDRITYKFADDNVKPATVAYDYAAAGNLSDQAADHLIGLGYTVSTIIPIGSDSYMFAVDYTCADAMSDLGWPLK